MLGKGFLNLSYNKFKEYIQIFKNDTFFVTNGKFMRSVPINYNYFHIILIQIKATKFSFGLSSTSLSWLHIHFRM